MIWVRAFVQKVAAGPTQIPSTAVIDFAKSNRETRYERGGGDSFRPLFPLDER